MPSDADRVQPRWLHEDGPDEWTVDRIDPCEAGTCGHAGCWQDDQRDTYQARVRKLRDELRQTRGTG